MNEVNPGVNQFIIAELYLRIVVQYRCNGPNQRNSNNQTVIASDTWNRRYISRCGHPDIGRSDPGFRIGCIGRLNADHMRGVLAAIAQVLSELGVTSLRSAA